MDDARETPSAPLLELTDLSKAFPGVQALDKVDFTLRAGEIHALLGENGAGKSTLIKVLTGVFRRDGGTILLDGREIAARDPADALALGIGTVYQEVNMLPNLSVAENLFLGRQPRRFGLVATGEMRRRAAALLEGYGLDINVADPLGRYSVAVQQIVAIARAVDLSAKVLILDEPTASLDAGEVRTLFSILGQLKERGIGIVFVTHFLDQVYAVCDRITVLRNGRLVGSRDKAALPRLELVAMMLGRELAEEALHRASRPPVTGEPIVAFEGYGRSRLVEPFDLALRRGEVVGLAGLLGSGRTETAKLVFGIEKTDRGRAFVDGKPVRIASPRDAARLGFGFCPEDRKSEGIVAELSVRENIVLALQARRGWLRLLAPRGGRRRSPTASSSSSTSARRMPRSPSGCCPAATSRRRCSPAGSPRNRASSSSTSRRGASTSERTRRSSASSKACARTASRSSSSRPSSRRSPPTATGSSCCATGATCASFPGTKSRPMPS